MDYFFDELPSTSHEEHDESVMSGGGDFDPSRETSSSSCPAEMQEQQSQYMNTCSVLSKEDSSIENISRRAQELVEKINENRTSDQQVMDIFQQNLQEKVTEMCQKMKEGMYKVYEKNSDEMQVKLQELSGILDSCTKLNQELLEAVQALACLREGLAVTQKSEP